MLLIQDKKWGDTIFWALGGGDPGGQKPKSEVNFWKKTREKYDASQPESKVKILETGKFGTLGSLSRGENHSLEIPGNT